MSEIGGSADALEWYRKHGSEFHKHWTERRPAALEMTDSERLDWLGEYCDRHEYVAPTANSIGHHVIICDGEKTVAASFRDAVDAAAAKFKEANA